MLSDRMKLRLEIVLVLFAVVSAVATCASTYFAYKTIQIYQEQNQREKRKEFVELMSMAAGFLKGVAEEVKKDSSECANNKTSADPNNNKGNK